MVSGKESSMNIVSPRGKGENRGDTLYSLLSFDFKILQDNNPDDPQLRRRVKLQSALYCIAMIALFVITIISFSLPAKHIG